MCVCVCVCVCAYGACTLLSYRCYRSTYSIRRCDDCLILHKKNPGIFALAPAFPPSTRELLLCNICKILGSGRTGAAEEKRRIARQKSAYKQVESGMSKRQKEKVARHIRKWRAECVRDNLDYNSKEASRRLSCVKSQASYYGNQVAWHYYVKKFGQRKLEKNRDYNRNELDQYLNIPEKYK